MRLLVDIPVSKMFGLLTYMMWRNVAGNAGLGRIVYRTLITSVSDDVIFDRKKAILLANIMQMYNTMLMKRKPTAYEVIEKKGAPLFGHY